LLLVIVAMIIAPLLRISFLVPSEDLNNGGGQAAG
jgi:hypothetical protein